MKIVLKINSGKVNCGRCKHLGCVGINNKRHLWGCDLFQKYVGAGNNMRRIPSCLAAEKTYVQLKEQK